MQIAMAAADFSAGEADQLRRSMAAWKRKGGVSKFHDRLIGGMLKNGTRRSTPTRSSNRLRALVNTVFREPRG